MTLEPAKIAAVATDVCVVYRITDPTGRLIYIGATSNLPQRLVNHRTQAWWWSLAADIATDVQPDMKTAFNVEHAAIRAERPAFNIVATRGRSKNYQHHLTDDDMQVLHAWMQSKRRGSGTIPIPLLREYCAAFRATSPERAAA